MASTIPVKIVKPKNYLNNRDILKEIHLSKTTYCSFLDPVNDHQYDIILPTVEKINQRTVAEARRNRADRIKRETGVVVDPKKIPNTDLVFRVLTWEHIPMAPKKQPKVTAPKKKKLEDIFDFDVEEPVDELIAELIESAGVTDMKHVKLPFGPFFHYRIGEDKKPFLVGKSHWQGNLVTGEFNKDHGKMTPKLAHMFIKLSEKYGGRSNWRGYTYNEEMRGMALLQLSQIGLQFDESKSQNPFAYYTAAITNSFTHVLNREKKMQNIRDDMLEMNGLNPSWTRQAAGKKNPNANAVVTYIDPAEYNDKLEEIEEE